MVRVMSHSYTKSILMNNERIVYSGHLHYFCYVQSVVIIVIGMFLFGLIAPPDVSSHVDQKTLKEVNRTMDQVKEGVDKVQKKLEQKVEEVTSFLPEEMKGLTFILTKMNTAYFGAILMFLGCVNLMKTYVHKHSSEHVVTTRKVVYKQGFISVDSVEINLDHIDGVKVKQTVLDRLIGRGDILINGIGLEQIEILKIADPGAFRKAVLEALEKYVSSKKS